MKLPLAGLLSMLMFMALASNALCAPPAVNSSVKPLPAAAQKRLLRDVASYTTDAFLADTLVRPHLSRLLGDELPHLRKNIDVRGSAAFSSGMVYVTGNAPHQGGEEHGFVGIDSYSGQICAALLSQGKFEVYGAGMNRSALPVALREWILATWAYVKLDGSLPPTATLLGERPQLQDMP
jgi:hypothetical protein